MIIISCVALCGCQCGSSDVGTKNPVTKAEQTREQQIENQRDFLKKERQSIEGYMEDRGLNFERTGMGLYYYISKDSLAGGNAAVGDEVLFDYSISLLNGVELYTSERNGPRKLRVDKQDAEIGLHEALKLLGVGDEGLFILPSHLAFGVAGDQNKVPPVTALTYKLKILKLEKSNKE
jgi:FKBP-type peptidyl-prolyl cis-trans isomerase FkpA